MLDGAWNSADGSVANVEAWRAAMATVSSAAWSDPPDGAEPIREPYAVNE